MVTSVAGVPGQDPTVPFATVTLDGQSKVLCFDLNALARIYQQTGKNLLSDDVALSDPALLRTILCEALRREDPSVTEDWVGKAVTPANWSLVAKAVLAALGASQAEPDPDAPKETPSDPPSA